MHYRQGLQFGFGDGSVLPFLEAIAPGAMAKQSEKSFVKSQQGVALISSMDNI